MATLFLVATPIGHLEDVTLRGLKVLGEVGLIAAEDTRQTRKLLTRYRIRTPLISYHEHNKVTRLDAILRALDAGDVALVSDAGTPGLSDPGYELVKVALAHGHKVSPIPGASAPIAALVASGLPTDTFTFVGYLPRRRNERKLLLRSLAGERRTLLAFEVPHRLQPALRDLIDVFGPDRSIAVCRELTKFHEEIVRGTLRSVLNHFEASEARGEFTLVIAGSPEQEAWDERSIRAALKEELAHGATLSEGARRVAARTGWTRREIYRMGLEET